MGYNNSSDYDLTFDGTQKEELEIGEQTDEEILTILRTWRSNSEEITKKLFTEAKVNLKYYKGEYDRDLMIPIWNSKIKDNRIFSSTKATVPFVTSKPAEPVVYAKKFASSEEKLEEAKKLAQYTQEILKVIYNNSEIQKKNEINTLNRYIYKIGVLKYFIEDGRICVKVINPQSVIFDKDARTYEEQYYIWEICIKSAEDLMEMFPKKKEDIKKKVNSKLATKLQLIEWWTKEYKISTIGTDIILEKIENPLFDYDRKEYNYFPKAPLPYVFLNVYNSGLSLLDDISEIDLSIDLQDGINDILRYTIDNLKHTGSPVSLFHGIDSTKAEAIINNTQPGRGVLLNSDQDVTYLQAAPLPGYAQNTLSMLYTEIDNIFGTQQTFRGEFEAAQSGSSREVLRAGSENSLAPLSRGVERSVSHLYKGLLHLLYVFCDDSDFVENQIKPILGDLTDDFLELLYNNIEDGMEVSVLAGSMLPDDKVTQREEAIQLAQYGKISTRLLYERLGIINPEEEATKFETEATLAQIQNAKLEMQAKQEEARIQAEAQKQAQGGAMAQSELANINSEIDSLGQEGGWMEDQVGKAQAEDQMKQMEMEMNNMQ